MDRRQLLTGIAASAVLSLTGCASTVAGAVDADRGRPVPARPAPAIPAVTGTRALAPLVNRYPLPGGTITGLPGSGNLMAWTVDDGASSEVVAAYARFAADSGVRLTFFANGMYASWTDNAPALRPLVDSGQVQIGNHTFDHKDLTSLSDAGIVDQLKRNEAFLANLYGTKIAPFYRPPYGYYNDHVGRVATSIGYSAPVLWYGSLSDSGLESPEQVVQFAQQWFLPQHIVIGHANFDPVTKVYGQLLDILHQRTLRTVTLRDVFAS